MPPTPNADSQNSRRASSVEVRAAKENSGGVLSQIIICNNENKARQAWKDKLEVATFWVLLAYTVVTTGVLGVNIWQAYLTNGALDVARQQAEIMRNDQRPWIHVKGEAFGAPMIFDAQGLHGQVLVMIENIGHLPATHAYFTGRVFAPKTGDQVRKMQADLCNGPVGPGLTLFPGETPSVPTDISVSMEDIKASQDANAVFKERNWVAIQFVGCVIYWMSDASHPGHTPFMFEFAKRAKGREGSYTNLSPTDGTIAPEAMKVLSNPNAGGMPAD